MRCVFTKEIFEVLSKKIKVELLEFGGEGNLLHLMGSIPQYDS